MMTFDNITNYVKFLQTEYPKTFQHTMVKFNEHLNGLATNLLPITDD